MKYHKLKENLVVPSEVLKHMNNDLACCPYLVPDQEL